MTPALLLTFTFLLGCGISLTLPASQALVQELVPRAQVRSAAALGGVAVNGARAVGPAVAGLIIAQVGPGVVFGLNAVGFLVLAAVLLRLRRAAGRVSRTRRNGSSPPSVRVNRYVRHSKVVRRLLLRWLLFVLPGAALWALLPLVAIAPTRLDRRYGVLLAALGAGAVRAPPVTPVSARLPPNRIFVAGSLRRGPDRHRADDNLAVVAVLLPAGAAWLAVLVEPGALQVFLPGWVRARGLSMQQDRVHGRAGGRRPRSGACSPSTGVWYTFAVASALMALGATTSWCCRCTTPGVDRNPAVYWPEPELAVSPSRRGAGAGHADLHRRGRPGTGVPRRHGGAPPIAAAHRSDAVRPVPGRGRPDAVRAGLGVPHVAGDTCGSTPAA